MRGYIAGPYNQAMPLPGTGKRVCRFRFCQFMNRAEIKAAFMPLSDIVLCGLAVLVPTGTNPLRVIHLDSPLLAKTRRRVRQLPVGSQVRIERIHQVTWLSNRVLRPSSLLALP